MKNMRKRWGLGAALVLGGASLLALATPSVAASASPTTVPAGCTPMLRHVNMNIPGTMAATDKCRIGKPSDAANGTPPLLFHGGNVMATRQTGPLIVTPIFWSPRGYPMSSAYTGLLLNYLFGVAKDSGQRTNVYSVLPEYFGANGQIRYNVQFGFPIFDSHPLPPSGCTVASTDTANIYADGSGYSACLDDDQVQAEINRVTGFFLPHNLTHIYVMYLPKGVESCFFAGSTTTAANACTINYQPSAAYCAYHNIATSNAIYANMPYPIYLSKTNFTCGTDVNFPGVIESPNGNPDADTEISPTSHEINEAITDPDTVTGWYDSSGFENGDECAYIFGQVHGAPGAFWNQTINGRHFLTQEEFSNRDFAITGKGCVQNVLQEA